MSQLRNLIRGAGFAFDGIRTFYHSPQLWKYAAFPLIPILLTYCGMVLAGWYLVSWLADFFAGKCADLPGFLQWLATAASTVSAAAAVLLFSVIAITAVGSLYELFGGLFFDALIHRFAGISSPEMLRESNCFFNIHALADNAVYSFKTLLIILAFAVLGLFLPLVGQVAGVIVISYRFGVSYLAMCGFHYRRNMYQTRMLAYKNFMLTLGYGASIYLIFLFPLAVIFTLPGVIIGGVKLYNMLCTGNCHTPHCSDGEK